MPYQLSPRKKTTKQVPGFQSQKELALFPFFNNKRKEQLYRELQLLLQANIPLEKAMEMIIHLQKEGKHQEFFANILKDVQHGKPFFKALQAQKNCSDFEWNTIKIGEETGYLPNVIGHLHLFFKRKNEFRKTLSSALAYPLLLFVTATIVVIFMLTTVVPLFEGIFNRQGIPLPKITRWVVGGSAFLKTYFLHFFILAVGIAIGVHYALKIPKLKSTAEQILIKTPFVRNLLRLHYTYRFCQSMELLVKAKMDLVKSFQLIQSLHSFHPLTQALQQIETDIIKGNSLSSALKKTNFFEHRMHGFIHVGEESHQLDAIFEELTAHYGAHIAHASKRWSSLLEPIIILWVGLLMAFILVGMYMPMFQLSTQFG